MLQIETVVIDKQELVHTYSDANFKIMQEQTGILYDEAYDIPNKYTYIETDVPIEEEEPEDEQQ